MNLRLYPAGAANTAASWMVTICDPCIRGATLQRLTSRRPRAARGRDHCSQACPCRVPTVRTRIAANGPGSVAPAGQSNSTSGA